MEPSRDSALVDLLDRVLDQGVVLHADIVISVAEIPLIGVNLRAAIAGIKTMLDYGMMEAWDAKIRRLALEGECKEDLDLEAGEELVYSTFASTRTGESTATWKRCHLYLTNFRLVLLTKKPKTILLELHLRRLCKVSLMKGMYLGIERKILTITHKQSLRDEREIKILSDDTLELVSKIRETMSAIPVKVT